MFHNLCRWGCISLWGVATCIAVTFLYIFFLLKLVDGVVEVLCFVGIQGYSQGADLTARGGRGGAVYTWVIASILPFQTPTVTHQ